MIIFLDFDGTVVEHKYPFLGKYNFGCFEVINKLKRAGHQIMLNTMRVEFQNGSLEEAIKFIEKLFLNMKNEEQEPFHISFTDCKYLPTNWDWNLHLNNGYIYIDDICEGIPLKKELESERLMVDWNKLDVQFNHYKLYD